MSRPAVRVSSLTKTFGATTALDDVCFDIPQGSVFGLLGPNGAGKTTLLKILLGLSRASAGSVEIFGGSPAEPTTRARIGFVPDVPEFDGWMTASGYLMSVGRLLGMDAAESERRARLLLDRVGLAGVETKIRGFSRGMRQRLGIAQALINGPDLLILDEPTTALDPEGRVDLLNLIRDVSTHATVVFSTHLLDDVDRVCDSVLVLNTSVVTVAPIADLRSTLAPQISIEAVGTPEQIAHFHAGLLADASVRSVSKHRTSAVGGAEVSQLTLTVSDASEVTLAIPRIASATGIGLRRVTPIEQSMETIFMHLIGGRDA